MELIVLLSDTKNLLNLNVQESYTILQVKELISAETNIPVESLFITYIDADNQIVLTDNDPVDNLRNYILIAETKSATPRPKGPKYSDSIAVQEAPMKDWLGILIEKINVGSLALVIQLIEEFESEQSQVVREEIDLLNQRADNGWGAIHHACQQNRASIVQFLLSRGACCNTETDDNWTPLHISVFNNHIDCVRHLLNHPHIQINRSLPDKGTALHTAVRRGNSNIVLMLLESNADMTIEDHRGKIPLQLAKNPEIGELIPKFMGKKMFAENEHEFNPEVYWVEAYLASSLELDDLYVFLVIDPQQGAFMTYESSEAYHKQEEAFEVTKLISIYEIREDKGDFLSNERKFYFLVHSQLDCKRYYVRSEYIRQEFIDGVKKAIDYCQIHKIGMDQPLLIGQTAMALRYTTIEPRYNSLGQLRISLDDFAIIEEVGKGSFGKVFKVMKKDTKIIYALKKISKKHLIKQNQLKYAIAECKVLKILSHTFVIRLHYAFQTDSNLYMVLDFCPNGDLSMLVSERGRLSEEISKFYFAEILLAVEYLHSLNIVYRDLKPENILLDLQGHIRLADFGLAKENVNPLNPAMSFCGSPAYIAPELLKRKGILKEADIYTLGIILFELITGNLPFLANNIGDLFKRIKTGTFKFPRKVSHEAEDLIRKLLNKNPQNRPSIAQIKEHIFFRDMDWINLELKRIPPPKLGGKFIQLESDEPLKENTAPRRLLRIEEEEEFDENAIDVDEFNFRA